MVEVTGQKVSGPLEKLRWKMSVACELDRPKSMFHPIDNQVPHSRLLHVSDRLYTAVPNQPEETTLEKQTYTVTVSNHNKLLPGLQKESNEELPNLLATRHDRVSELHDCVLARSIRKEVELSGAYFYPTMVAGLLLWSDGLNPNTSKDQRGSVWLLLATLVLNWGKDNPGACTYPLATGPAVSQKVATWHFQQ